MKLFSQRKGLKPVKSIIQIDSMDEELRNRLWNLLILFYWSLMESFRFLRSHNELHLLLIDLWHFYFKKPLDSLDMEWDNTRYNIKKYFFSCKWNEVYDFIEFIAKNYADQSVNQEFVNACNDVLESELSGYRFVGFEITQMTSKQEIAEIEEALDAPKPVSNHLKKALQLFANKKSPDYTNAVKESILAVEAICQMITGEKSVTLGQCLKVIKSKVGLHPALEESFNKLYGYASDAEGIRHALLEESNLDFEDAKFMLVSCSAFVNYLIAKSSKAGIEF
jgi:hypothetical protein